MINQVAKVQTSNLTVHYPNSEKPALDSVTMTVLQSSFYTILGTRWVPGPLPVTLSHWNMVGLLEVVDFGQKHILVIYTKLSLN